MKKIKMLLLSLLLVGCGYAPMDSAYPIVIEEVEQGLNCYCNYYGRGNTSLALTITSWDYKFRDTCGKFQIGDTVNFVKK